MILVHGGMVELFDYDGDKETTCNVTVDDFYFENRYITPNEYFETRQIKTNYAPTENDADIEVTYEDAALYCNSRSRKEGFIPCYTFDSEGELFCNEEADGYRLPTRAECERVTCDGAYEAPDKEGNKDASKRKCGKVSIYYNLYPCYLWVVRSFAAVNHAPYQPKIQKTFSYDVESVGSVGAFQNKNGKWELFCLSELIDIDMGEYRNRFTDYEFDEIKDYTSSSGPSYIAVRRGDEWGLIQIDLIADIGNKNPPADQMGCEVKWIEPFIEKDCWAYEQFYHIQERGMSLR